VENAGVLPASRASLAAVATRRQDPVARETLGVWTLLAVDAAAIFATYSREPLSQLYHVSDTGPAAGAGRVLVFLDFPTALAALAVLAFVTTRATRAVGVLAAALCAGVVWPGIVNQADLDARWVNVVPAAGVLLAVALTIWRAASSGISRPTRHRGDGWRLAAAVVVLVAALPWAAAELGLFVGDMSAWWAPLGQARLHPAVHHGHHHGIDGTLLVLTALLLSRALVRLPAWLRTTVGLYLGVLLTYGLGNMLNDDWYEQVVKRGWASFSMPGVLLPTASLPWALILVVGLAIGGVFLRAADEGSPPRRVVPRAAVAVPALAVLALIAIGAVQHRERTASTPYARVGAGTIVFPMAPGGTFHLYEIGADGQGLRQLTHGSDLAPNWSRQGRLAFQRKSDVIVAGRRLAGNGRDGEPAWSPDGRRLAFVRDGDLYVVRLPGDRPRPVAADASWPSWAPRTSLLAFEVDSGGRGHIETSGADGDLEALHTRGDSRFPAWAPRGDVLAYECRTRDHWQICTFDPRTGASRMLTSTGSDAFAPAWSPDGRRIAFIGDRDGNDQLYVMRADGSGIVRLTRGQADKDAPAWRT
jgi:WD40-like Beta Propeller Repeat